ncbi:hypothetical protein RND81_14G139500 [Saponaria officinalis]|uniref:Uncharacterized protein n=1 Tax=Saponaria officinalis TaxID=3572 RepID=A0AAW1GPK2_SAPOF
MKEHQITIRESPTTRAMKRASTSKEVQPKRQRVINDVERLPSLRTRMSPAAIKNIGFGGLLHLQTDTIPGQLAYWLASSFDPYKSSLMDEHLPIQDVDIHIALGILIRPRVVNEAVHNDKSEEFSHQVEKWKLQYDKDKKIESKDILAKMKLQRDGGEDFKRNFIVYIVSTFLGGVKSSIVSLKILKTLGNIDDIPLYNWCEFTRKKLVENVILWQKEELRLESGKKNVFKGPIMVLVYIYLDHVVFKSRTVHRTFSTVSSWSKESINYLKEEKKLTKTFGKGFVDCRMIIEEENADNKTTSSFHHEPEENEKVKMCVEKLVLAVKKLASSFEEFKYAVNEAIHELPDSVAILKMGKQKMYPSEDEYEDEEPEENEK